MKNLYNLLKNLTYIKTFEIDAEKYILSKHMYAVSIHMFNDTILTHSRVYQLRQTNWIYKVKPEYGSI